MVFHVIPRESFSSVFCAQCDFQPKVSEGGMKGDPRKFIRQEFFKCSFKNNVTHQFQVLWLWSTTDIAYRAWCVWITFLKTYLFINFIWRHNEFILFVYEYVKYRSQYQLIRFLHMWWFLTYANAIILYFIDHSQQIFVEHFIFDFFNSLQRQRSAWKHPLLE